MQNKERPYLEIHLDNDYVCLKGTGNDVEPARLTGHVALYLAESTPIKEITLQFRGKARLPPNPADAGVHVHNSVSTYIVCTHDWSFLEGEKKHSHTLKAGCHFFPFQLQIGGSLPSSMTSPALGGASIAYKLRAHVVRPGLHHNLQIVIPVHILRSFSSEALEYQQTLEIENTWVQKGMYQIMIPHKAWAATDTLTALLKFSPLVKGVSVISVNTTIQETTKIKVRSSSQEYTRIVAATKHEIVGGKAVEVPLQSRYSAASTSALSSPNIPSVTPPSQVNDGSYFPPPPASTSTSSQGGPSPGDPDPEPISEQGQDDVVTYLSLYIPLTATPTHAPAPITVTHRLRWNILIMNPDGHTSELRCSLPLHLLDHRLLQEARANTAATRRLLIRGPEVPEEEEEETQLPSYKAHVRDRVANMYLPEAATVRVTNPWLLSPTDTTPPGAWRSGHATPLETPDLLHLPHAPGSGGSTPLDWVNSELLLSMESRSLPSEPFVASSSRLPSSHSGSEPTSHAGSRPPSARASRRNSRASSPERHNSLPVPAIPVAKPNETYVHSSNASRNLHGVFNASMKPFTALAHPHWLSPSRSASHPTLSALSPTASTSSSEQQRHCRPLAATAMRPVLLQRAYSEVPDYDVAARGFIGGVPPLSSMHGLPSYEEAEHSHSTPVTPAAH
ncbi:Arrestin-C domain-containing protein [Mycena sanguinolenta]|uniref:Arrestin-C domain-containing protein n=1 Tax=Mycena sanguinolenta TaxID=230812 RepID=A0A8H6ZJ30_9AGAR|nr:Arrestin-C domain-containing protein [Mycena sanguinolenta]